jgi:nitronate monooxygenase
VLAAEARGAGLMEIAALVTGERCKEAWATGDVDIAPMMMGQSLGRIYDVKSCAEVIEDMVKQAKDEISRVSRLF